MSNHGYNFVYAADVKDVEAEGKFLSLSVKKHPVALFCTILRFMLWTIDALTWAFP